MQKQPGVPEQAETVMLIYKLFLEGSTTLGIANFLTAQVIPSPAGKEKWHSSTIVCILVNELSTEIATLFYRNK